MISNPRPGQAVRVRYSVKRWRTVPRWQDAVGRVVVPSRGRPRNHLVEIAGELIVIPAGNLMVPLPASIDGP